MNQNNLKVIEKLEDFGSLKKIDKEGRFYQAEQLIGDQKIRKVFLKLDRSPRDKSLSEEYENGLKVNQIKEIPNFIRTFNCYWVETGPESEKYAFPREVLMTEYFDDPLLSNTSPINLEERFTDFLQLACSVWFANSRIGLHHGDLHNQNIIVHNLKSEVTVNYGGFRLKIKRLLLIYDFGRATFNSITGETRSLIHDLSSVASACFQNHFPQRLKSIHNLLQQKWINMKVFLQNCQRIFSFHPIEMDRTIDLFDFNLNLRRRTGKEKMILGTSPSYSPPKVWEGEEKIVSSRSRDEDDVSWSSPSSRSVCMRSPSMSSLELPALSTSAPDSLPGFEGIDN